jgi:hypothetical protein
MARHLAWGGLEDKDAPGQSAANGDIHQTFDGEDLDRFSESGSGEGTVLQKSGNTVVSGVDPMSIAR